MSEQPKFDVNAVRAKLAPQKGKQYWRSLEELAEKPDFQLFLDHEFPQHSENWEAAGNGNGQAGGGVNRRQLLSVMGASLAMAGLTGCTRPPDDTIVPYVLPPEIAVPGKPLFFATTFVQNGIGSGVLVESHLGRPTKIEGNPDHPGSLGAADAITQASILQLYDPDRSQAVNHLGNISSWEAFQAWFNEHKPALDATKGAGLHILTELSTSPTLASQIEDLLKQWPQAKFYAYEPAGFEMPRAGAKLAFGEIVNTIYDFSKASVVVSLSSDFLSHGRGNVRYTRDFIKRRREEHANRLYVVETSPTSTGAFADHRLPMRASEMEAFAQKLAAAVDGKSIQDKWITAMAADLKKNGGSSIVIAGDEQPPMVHALAHHMNQALGNNGKTVMYTGPLTVMPEAGSITDLTLALQRNEVEMLFVFGANPYYNAPGDLYFRSHFPKAKNVVHAGLYNDETAEWAHWHLPEAHYLESWGDARAFDGSISLVQPLIAPLYEGRSMIEIFSALLGKPGRSGYDIVREFWKTKFEAKPAGPAAAKTAVASAANTATWDNEFEGKWRKALHDGIVADSTMPTKSVSVKPLPATNVGARAALEVVFRPDPTVGDGRWANNGWLQELPKAMTRLTWDSAAQVSPSFAESHKLENGDMVKLSVGQNESARKIEVPLFISPGQAEDSLTVTLGYGRWRGGRVASGLGFNACDLRASATPWFITDAKLEPLGRKHELAATHLHHAIEDHSKTIHGMEGRRPVVTGTFEEFEKHPDFVRKERENPPQALSLFPSHNKPEGYAWGLTIDLSSCVGCNACVVACQSENNIPVVGKDQVIAGREMHWIRIDRYYEGENIDNPDMHFQPVPCMQCENAPCELVCPVEATAHTEEGLNDQVYNRCVGTRYCSNNCPYKVRRFNFLQYQDWDDVTAKVLEGMRNPNVSVRSRGVMEKCTYCVQRISAAKIDAEKQDRSVRDGEIKTACQQTCPADAIVFGNINDPNSRVSKLKASPLNYGLLEELQTRPRTTYLARLRNPNPELESPAAPKEKE